MTAKKRKEAVIIPAELFFYPIPLTQPSQHLTREELRKHFEAPKGRKAYMGNDEEFISFQNSILTVKVHLNDNSEYYLYLHAESEELHVACSCGMPGDKLCFHAFMGLHGLCWQSAGFNCQKLYWPGFYDNAITRKFLNVEINKRNVYVTSKPDYGQVFRSEIGFALNPPPLLAEKDTKDLTVCAGEQVIYAYALCFAPDGFRDRHYPLLIPFYGTTGKNGLKVVSFSTFVLPGKKPKPNDNHPLRRELNVLAETMYTVMKPYTTKWEMRDKVAWDKVKQTFFELWQKALPLLVNQPYNQTYYLYWFGYLKERPMKRVMTDCRYSLERPSLIFLLSFHKDHFNLSVEVIVGSEIIAVKLKPHLFVFDENSKTCYLMNSIQDDDLLIWMLDNKNKITVLKNDFAEFNSNFLADLSESYSVFVLDRGLRIGYDYQRVRNSLGL